MAVRIYPDLMPLLVPLRDLHQHPGNPNNADMDLIRESILLNGYYAPIIIDQAGQILAGNHRYAVMAELGEPAIPAIRIDPDTVVGKRILLVDNESTRKGWDDPALRLSLLREIADANLPTAILGTGYSEAEWLAMIRAEQDHLHFGQSDSVSILVECDDIDAARDLAAELIERGFSVDGRSA